MPDDIRKAMAVMLTALCLLILLISVLNTGNVSAREKVYRSRSGPCETTPVFFAAGKVHVNQASLEELTQLNGVGLSIAEEIVAERNENGPFYFPEDLISVRGIGMKKLSLFRNDLSFDDDECEGQ